MRLRRFIAPALLVAVCACAAIAWWMVGARKPSDELILYGNIDLRQVELAFNDSDRIASVDAQEGDRLSQGQVVARLDVSRLGPALAQAQAAAEGQRAVAAKMHAGSRPQEIAQAKAELDAAEADALDARLQYERANSLWGAASGQAAVSRQDVDNAKAAMDAAAAKTEAQRKAYELAAIGYRHEDIDQADALLRADEAQLALLRQEFADASLRAPVNGVVRARLMEPGEMASPQRPVFTIAETDPKWVRTYVNETALPHVRPGMAAQVTVDGQPHRVFKGWVGFISSVAEFTPKTVQTAELRTSLVYEVRVFVRDPDDELPLGMPATVTLRLSPAAQEAGS
jgi:HlyD family secretion protein